MVLVCSSVLLCVCVCVCDTQNSEITVEKYISPEERKRMEEVEKQEEQRRLAEMVGSSKPFGTV